MASLIDRWFIAHPRSVGETYSQHFRVAARFGVILVGGGFACLVHAFLPMRFERTGSGTVKRLYSEMVARQPGASRPAHEEQDWQLEYEI